MREDVSAIHRRAVAVDDVHYSWQGLLVEIGIQVNMGSMSRRVPALHLEYSLCLK